MSQVTTAMIDLGQEIENSTDFRLLNLILSATDGQKFLEARLSYGDSLDLHFGERLLPAHPKLERMTRGPWVLATRASHWRVLLQGPGVIFNTGIWNPFGSRSGTVSLKEIAALINKLAAAKLDATQIYWPPPPSSGPYLKLTFEDGSRFELAPDPASFLDRGECDRLPDWELHTPYTTYLRVGPGPVWSLLRTDVPMRDQVKPALTSQHSNEVVAPV